MLDALTARTSCFIFPRCQARVDGAGLGGTVALPHGVSSGAGGAGLAWGGPRGPAASGAVLAWSAPLELPADVLVDCLPGLRQRADAGEYPIAAAYAVARTVRFRGGFRYFRAPYGDGWALFVQAAVRQAAGLPQGE